MPTRMIREGILTSDRVNALTAPEEVFYRRLLSVVDDYGRFDGRPSLMKATCYPLRVDSVREADISRWTAACEKAGLLVLFTVNSKPYLEVQDFDQQIRAKKSKYPAPPDDLRMRRNGAADALHVLGICDASAPVVEVEVEVEGERAPGRAGERVAHEPEGFARFWAEWPSHKRKAARKDCLARWKAAKLEGRADEIVRHVRALKSSEDWTKEGGQFIPAPLVYLNQERFDAPVSAKTAAKALPF